METELTDNLEVVSRFAEPRQRELAEMLTGLLEMEEEHFKESWERDKKLTEGPDSEFDDAYWARVPKENIAIVASRDPTDPDATLTKEFAAVIERIKVAPRPRQDYVNLWLNMVIENESLDVQLTDEQRQSIRDAIAELDRGAGRPL